MIENLTENCGEIMWNDDKCNHIIAVGNGTFINDEKTILIMNEARDKVIVLDEKGNEISEIFNSESVYLMYLQKHPRFGIGIVASIKDENNHWNDKFLAYTNRKFVPVVNSR